MLGMLQKVPSAADIDLDSGTPAVEILDIPTWEPWKGTSPEVVNIVSNMANYSIHEYHVTITLVFSCTTCVKLCLIF